MTKLIFQRSLVFLISLCAACVQAAGPPLTRYVNLFQGTKPAPTGVQGFTYDTGDVFPGVTYPMGMVQFSPDTPSRIPGGYWYPDSLVNSFSLTHYSGRGIIYEGDIGFMPVSQAMSASTHFSFSNYTARFAHENEAASPGFYHVKLDDGVVVELTDSPHAGMLRATFPSGTTRGTLLINVGNSVRGTKDGGIRIVDGRELTGFAESTISNGKLYRIYFSIVFDQPIAAYGTWHGPVLAPGVTNADGAETGAYVTLDTDHAKVVCATAGISYVSVANARLNRETECPKGNFDKTKQAAGDQWDRMLHAIVIDDPHATLDNLAVFYTALYHTLIHPNIFDDVNGEYLGFDNVVHKSKAGHHQFTHIDAWGGYQTGTPLVAFLFPNIYSDVPQSLVNDAAQNGGSVIRWAQQNGDSKGNNGDCGSTTIANAYAFGATGFDAASALTYMIANASGSNQYRTNGTFFQSQGWVPNDGGQTLEYCVADMALAQFAGSLGNMPICETYRSSAQNWRKIFNPDTRAMNPRSQSGAWGKPNAGWYEGTQEQYTWMVPFNIRGLMDAMGGNEAVVARLDRHFGWDPERQMYTKLNSGAKHGTPYYWIGNEENFPTPWLYLYAGAPWKSQKVLRDIQTSLFANDPSGMPGNDDAGATSSWYVFSALGIYPIVPGVGGFALGSPLFASATLKTESGHVLRIKGVHAAPASPYVQSLQVNGKPGTRLWLPIETILKHPVTTLTFKLGSMPNTAWATAASDAPPSFDAH